MQRLGDATAGPVTDIVSVPLNPLQFATVARADGRLQVISWSIANDGTITRNAAALGGATDRIAAAAMGRDRLVTAVRTANGTLRLTGWRIGSTGAITRLGDADAGAYQDGAATAVNRTFLVTALRDANSELKLISWRFDSTSGAITRFRDWSAGKTTRVDVVTLSQNRIVVGTRPPSGRLHLRALQLNATGEFASAGATFGPDVSEFALAPLSAERIVSAQKLTSGGTLALSSWNITPSGEISLRANAAAGAVGDVSLTTRGTAHAIAAVRQADGTFRMIAWDAVGNLDRLGTTDAGTASRMSAITLGTDRIITSVRTASGLLKVIAWRDRAVTMLRGSWGPTVRVRRPVLAVTDALDSHTLQDISGNPVAGPRRPRPGGPRPGDPGWSTPNDNMEPRDGQTSPALIGAAIRTGVDGVDPMLAVGHQFVVVSQDHAIAFFGRDGQRLSPKRGEMVQMSADEFFATFTDTLDENGKPNEHNINRHIGAGPSFPECNLRTLVQPCIVEFYDTRVVYDATSRRFVIVSAARGKDLAFTGNESRTTDPGVRRYFAVAISKTEDPRDGFWQYMTTESNYSDWPRVIAQHGVIVMGHNDYETKEWREGPKPSAYLFLTDSMRSGKARVPSWKLFMSETGDNVSLAANFGPVTGNWTSLTRRAGDVLHLYSFQRFPDLASGLTLSHDSVSIDADLPDKRSAFDVRRGDFLYLAGHLKVEDAVRNQRPARYSVRLVRFPLLLGTSGRPVPSRVPSRGFLDTYFGRSASSDAAGDRVSYEVPSVAVTKRGDMVFVYGRIPVKTAASLPPEARYSVRYADARGLQRSRLLQAGEWLPTGLFDSLSTVKTIRPFVAGQGKLDYTTAVVDPVDGETVWIAGSFADSTKQAKWDSSCGNWTGPRCRGWFSMVIGRVKP